MAGQASSGPLATGRAAARVTGSLTRAMVAGSLGGLRPSRQRVWRSLRITACIIAPLVVGLATDHITYGLAATFGAFAGFHGHDDPFPHRARLLALIGLAYVLAVMVGLLAATSPVVLVVVTSVFAGGASVVGQALQLPPPREFMLILIALLVGSLPVSLGSTATVLGLSLAGAAWAWLVLMSGWLWDREGPERRAQRTATQTVLDLLEEPPPVRSGALHDAVLVARTGRRAVELANGPNAPALREAQLGLEDLLDATIGLVIDERNVLRGTRVPAGEHPSPAPGWEPAPAADLVPDPRPELRIRARELLALTDQALPHRGVKRRSTAISPPLRGGLWPLRNALGSHSLVLPTAMRLGIAIAIALTLGQLSGAPKPYWIAVATGAVLQSATLLTTTRRAIERAFGTAVGVLIGGGIVLVEPTTAGIVRRRGVPAARRARDRDELRGRHRVHHADDAAAQ